MQDNIKKASLKAKLKDMLLNLREGKSTPRDISKPVYIPAKDNVSIISKPKNKGKRIAHKKQMQEN